MFLQIARYGRGFNNGPVRANFLTVKNPTDIDPRVNTIRNRVRKKRHQQEQIMFDDLRRGFTEDFEGLTEFERTFKDRPPKKKTTKI